ncbi:MAG: hypothetical protein RIS53_907 [Bacillota bacterium]|jgi:iron(III) transport system substrate-binding protein
MKKLNYLGIVPFILTILTGCQSPTTIVNLYTDRHYEVDQLLYDAFELETGIHVNVVKLDADPLLTRLETEADATMADLVFLTDAGRLGRAKTKGLLQSFGDEAFFNLVPNYMQDVDKQWIALTKRARIFVFNPEVTNVSALSTYEALAQPEWYEKIAVRSSSHVYNQSMVAAMIEEIGETNTQTWLNNLVDNFAIRDPLSNSKHPVGNDRDQAKAVYNGIAEVAIMNSYYFGKMLYSEDPTEVEVASALEVFFPNQDSFGTHINISGVGLTRYSQRIDHAKRFVEYMLSVDSQSIFADANFEYPARFNINPHPLLASWGAFAEQDIPLSVLSSRSERAFQMMLEAGWQ